MRHRLLFALIAPAVALAAVAPARAAVTIVVEPGDGPPVTLSTDVVEQTDVHERSYTVRGASGDSQIVVTGASIDRLLDRAGVDPFGFRGATITGAGRSVTLTRDQLTDVEAFDDGRPVLWADGQGVHFLRPSTGPGDLNADDALTVVSGALTVRLAAAGSLQVVARATRTRVNAGDLVAFTAQVSGAGGDQRVRVRWTFDDGGSGAGLRVRHRFGRPGTYKVVVGATTLADPAGASAIVTVRVGETPPGPDRDGGGTDPDQHAPDSGAATGPQRPARSAKPPSRSARKTRRRQPRRASLPPVRPADTVEGALIDATAPESVTAAARTGSSHSATNDRSEVSPALMLTAGALALVVLGAWLERLGTRRRPLVG